MKLLACLLIIVLCGYIGRLLSKRTLQRLEFFREYQSSYISLTDSITGMNLELCRALESSGAGSPNAFFKSCSKTLKESPRTRFGAIWERNLADMKLTYLTKEDVNTVAAGGTAIESLCMNPSERQSSGYIKRLFSYVEGLETEKRKKCKLYNTSGMLAGMLIALLMI